MKKTPIFVRVFLFFMIFNLGAMFLALTMEDGEDAKPAAVSYDENMSTDRFFTEVTIGEDSTYYIQETIDVNMRKSRHGIYRYIPQKGTIQRTDAQGQINRLPYKSRFRVTSCNFPLETFSEEGNYVMKLGSAEYTVFGKQNYEISYSMTPTVDSRTLDVVYLNVLPLGWQNSIPEGSGFSVTFPKEVDPETVQLYYGAYGEALDASSILQLSWQGQTLEGTLRERLGFGQGVTLYVPVGEDYFTGVRTFGRIKLALIICPLVILALTAVLFFLYGRDEELISSVQFQPPQDLDSAAVGYIVDGRVEDRDIISLIMYWADQGYITISQEDEKGLTLHKTSLHMPTNPQYSRMIYDKLFKKRDVVKVKDMSGKMADTIGAAKKLVKAEVQEKGGVYTKASMVNRILCLVLVAIPFLILNTVMRSISLMSEAHTMLSAAGILLIYLGCVFFCRVIDKWFSHTKNWRVGTVLTGLGFSLAGISWNTARYLGKIRSGNIPDITLPLIITAVCTALCVLFTGFMKKRTAQCVEWMGRLTGLREFIETAELDRLKVMAQDNPEWFYHILPYTYVFGLSDVFAEKLKDLAIPAPSWYEGDMDDRTRWSYYHFYQSFKPGLEKSAAYMTVPPATESSGSSSGGSSSGGGWSSGGGGGGFSGGGFGGGGGGSW